MLNSCRLRLALGLVVSAFGAACAAPAVTSSASGETPAADAWSRAEKAARIYADCAHNASKILHGWIDLKRDPTTHLYTRGREWNYENEAADHYSSLVLIAYFLDPALHENDGTLRQTLLNSIRLCNAPSGLPARFNLATGTPGKVDVGGICEWLRDGLLRITEVLGRDNDFYREFVRLTDAVLAEADRGGGLSSIVKGSEDEGNLMQVLARLAVMTGDSRYLDRAESMADAYLLADPLEKVRRFNFVDHGCELVPGLTELFVVESKLKRPRAVKYREPLRRLLDRLLEVGRHPETGLWYCNANLSGPQPADQGKPRKGKSASLSGSEFNPDVPHCWGYVTFAYENYDRATGENHYRDAVEKQMRWLADNRTRFDEVKNTLWPWSYSRGCFGDSYECMIILWNRYRDVPGVMEWLDWTTKIGAFRTDADPNYGPGSGSHVDGCTGRNLCAHMMLQSQGVRALPWQEGVACGAVETAGGLSLLVRSDKSWTGRLCFDGPRNVYPSATIDWTRINEMPQWYVVDPAASYDVRIGNATPMHLLGRMLIDGLPLRLQPGEFRRIIVQRRASGASS